MYRLILRGTFWLLVNNIVGRSTMFLINIVVARTLDPNIYGIFATARNTISMVEGITSASIGPTGTKNIAYAVKENPEKLPLIVTSLFLLNIFIALSLAVFIIIITPWIVQKIYFESAVLERALYIGSFILISSSLASVVQNTLIGFEKFKQMTFTSAISATVTIPVAYILIENFSLYGALSAIAFYALIDFSIKYSYLHKNLTQISLSLRIKEIYKKSKYLIGFSTPIIVSLIISSLVFWSARAILINQKGDFTEIALFDASFQWLSIIMIITSSSTNVILPMLSNKKYKMGSTPEKILKYGVLVNILISSIIAFIFIIFSKNIMSLYGEHYVSGTRFLSVLSLSSIPYSLALILNRYMISRDKSINLLYASIVSSPTLFILLYYFDITGVGLAWGVFGYYLSSVFYYLLALYSLSRKNNAK